MALVASSCHSAPNRLTSRPVSLAIPSRLVSVKFNSDANSALWKSQNLS